MKCQHCQQQHPSYSSYCPVTGKLIDGNPTKSYTYKTLEFCVSCGKQNNENYSCCSGCGTILLKSEAQKSGFSKKIAQNISSIPLSGEKISKHINTDQIKSVSQENINYIKQNRFIFLPILISMVLMLAFGFLMKDMMYDNLQDISDDMGNDALMVLFDAEAVEESLEDEFDVKVNIPTFPYATSLILLAHNANYEYKLDGEIDYYYDREKIELEGKFKNLSYGFTLIALIILTIGAIAYGIMTRKEQWSFGKGILYSSIAYALFIGIIAFIARYTVKLDIDENDIVVDIVGGIYPSLISTMIFSGILVAVIFSVVGYIAFHGKNTIAAFSTLTKYVQYAVYSLALTVVGIVIHFINMLIVFKDEELEEMLYWFDLGWLVESSVSTITALYLSVINWNVNLFGKLTIAYETDYSDESVAYKWFFNSSSETRELRNVIDEMLVVHPIVFVGLVLVIIGLIGYYTLPVHKLDLKEVAIFAGFFTAIQLFLVFFTGMVIEMDGDSFFSLHMTYSYISTLLGSFIMAFASIYAGGFIRQYLKK